MGGWGGTFETLKFSLQFLAELHLLQEQFLQFVCEGREWEVKEGAPDSGCPPPNVLQVLPWPRALRWVLWNGGARR